VWEGLGDFDRKKGHAWSDPVAEQVSLAHGAGPLWTPSSEVLFQKLVLGAVRDDPAWYAGIVARRLGATLTQWKLWPWRPWSGATIRPRTSDNEGFIDKYYGYATTADHLGLGRWRAELPVPALLLAVLALVVVAAVGPEPSRTRLRAALPLLAALAVAALPLPLFISTAAAQETQAFGIIYVVALALLVDEGYARARARARARDT
jgi:hypothetical protein